MNAEWEDRRIVDVVLKSRPDGSSNVAIAIGMRADALIAWHDANKPDWGLAWCCYKGGEWILEPTRDGHVKNAAQFELIEHVR